MDWGLETLKQVGVWVWNFSNDFLLQDHTQEQLPETDACMQVLNYTGSVLTAQGQALAKHGASLQAGGYSLVGWLHSVTLGKVVTHARTSDDYACWYNPETGVGKGCSRGFNNNYYNYATAAGVSAVEQG